jgi:methylmalonyl-CoA mutase N-terminal domain/subunit
LLTQGATSFSVALDLPTHKALEEVNRAAEKNENLVPPILEAVKQYATVGEISNVLREVYREYVGGKGYF